MDKELSKLMYDVLSGELELKSEPIPRVRSIKSLYNLWLLSKSRKDFYYEQLNNYINEVVEKIPPTINKKGDIRYVIYYKGSNYEEDGIIHKINIQYSDIYKCYTRSYHGHVGDSDNEVDNRDEIIDLTINGDLRLDMGTEYVKLDRLSDTGLSYIVYDELWSRINDMLVDRKIEDEIFIISICGDKYYVSRTDTTYKYYGRYNYKLLHRVDMDIIKF